MTILTKSETIDPRKNILLPGTGIDLSDEATHNLEEMEDWKADDRYEDWENDEENEI